MRASVAWLPTNGASIWKSPWIDNESPLEGGTLTPITRVGGTVRRAMGPWSSTVHRLLRHLEARGFDGAPRFLGVDGNGREVLSFIEGEVTFDGPPRGLHGDDALVAAAVLLRRFHDATEGFPRSVSDGWRLQVGAPTDGPVICHNDVGPYNTIYRAGRPIAFIDWDFAAPGFREWDVAYALWRFVPLYDDAGCRALGWPVVARGPRIARFLDAYGPVERSGLLALVLRRMEVVRATIASWADAGDASFIRLREEGRIPEIEGDIRFVEQSRRLWEPFAA